MSKEYADIARPVADDEGAVPGITEPKVISASLSENSPRPADEPLPDTNCYWDGDEPPPATIAALEFQVSCLVNDSLSTVNWRWREPIVVNKPGELSRKYEVLRRIAKSHFPRRGDVEDVLDDTIDEYKLWSWSNPVGFWTAFRRNMIDALKAAYNAKRVYLETGQRASSDGVRRKSNSHEWAESEETRVIDNQNSQNWLVQQLDELHAQPSVSYKWDLAQASNHQLDRLVCEAVRRISADDGYMEELASTKCESAKLTRFVTEIRSLADCSDAQAYRLLGNFKKRHRSKKN